MRGYLHRAPELQLARAYRIKTDLPPEVREDLKPETSKLQSQIVEVYRSRSGSLYYYVKNVSESLTRIPLITVPQILEKIFTILHSNTVP